MAGRRGVGVRRHDRARSVERQRRTARDRDDRYLESAAGTGRARTRLRPAQRHARLLRSAGVVTELLYPRSQDGKDGPQLIGVVAPLADAFAVEVAAHLGRAAGVDLARFGAFGEVPHLRPAINA